MVALLTSSDHHGNWQALEAVFKRAAEDKVPLVLNGDVIGDYNFEELAHSMTIFLPSETLSFFSYQHLDQAEQEAYSLGQQIERVGNVDTFLQYVQQQQKIDAQTEQQIKERWAQYQSNEFKQKMFAVFERVKKEKRHLIYGNKQKLRALFHVIVDEHAKKLAEFINTYQVQTYYLVGNHDPIYFVDIVKQYVTNKEHIVDMMQVGIADVNGLKCAGISNVSAPMGYLFDIFSVEEIFHKYFTHMNLQGKKYVQQAVSVSGVDQIGYKDDDWQRIAGSQEKPQLDVFFTHGQIGKGEWRTGRGPGDSPTLTAAAKLSECAHITVDGHLHTTHEMVNEVGTKTIRAVGNTAYALERDGEGVKHTLIEFDAPFEAKNGYHEEVNSLQQKIACKMWEMSESVEMSWEGSPDGK